MKEYVPPVELMMKAHGFAVTVAPNGIASCLLCRPRTIRPCPVLLEVC